jgi:hypothetical protein
MVRLIENLEFKFEGVDKNKKNLFEKTMNVMPIIIYKKSMPIVISERIRGYRQSNDKKEKNKIVVKMLKRGEGDFPHFAIYPEKGCLDYTFYNFKGQGFNKGYIIGFTPKNECDAFKNACFSISDQYKVFYFLNEHLVPK